jgi:hypothetical protein
LPISGDEATPGLHECTRLVFAGMAMAPYMGGALRALEEASRFLNSVHVDGVALASFDGYVADLGRAHIDYQVCQGLVDRFERRFDEFDGESFSAWIDAERPRALALKYHVTGVCEKLVDVSRKIIGSRSMRPSHIISKLSEQIRFGPLHPVINAKIERQLGAQLLNGEG